MACLKYLSSCPCPRCHVHKSQIAYLGRKSDVRTQSLLRIDDEARQKDIEDARRMIFDEGISITRAYSRTQFLGSWVCILDSCGAAYLSHRFYAGEHGFNFYYRRKVLGPDSAGTTFSCRSRVLPYVIGQVFISPVLNSPKLFEKFDFCLAEMAENFTAKFKSIEQFGSCSSTALLFGFDGLP